VAERRQQRVRALGSVLRSAASVTIFTIAGVVILGDLGINLAPLLASAGVVGIAIGFGAGGEARRPLGLAVVGGLVGKPVIGVPTSVGYGASLGGLAPLLTMLNSCAPNVTVVNIDNGFGAAFVAGLIARE